MIDHLPVGCTKIGTSFHADITDPRDLVPDNEPVVFVVGALAHGSVSQFMYSILLLSLK